jgi:uncharacterized membrane protein
LTRRECGRPPEFAAALDWLSRSGEDRAAIHAHLPGGPNPHMRAHKDWHAAHREAMPMGARIADQVATFIGSWRFIIIQSAIFLVWVAFNTFWLFEAYQFDPYPFILFNLFMSAEAAYASPLILMSQNRQSDRDRVQAQHDYDTNVAAKEEIERILKELNRIELEKLDKILVLLQNPPSAATR